MDRLTVVAYHEDTANFIVYEMEGNFDLYNDTEEEWRVSALIQHDTIESREQWETFERANDVKVDQFLSLASIQDVYFQGKDWFENELENFLKSFGDDVKKAWIYEHGHFTPFDEEDFTLPAV